jgi:sortase A
VRSSRLKHFYRTGRVIPFVGEMSSIEDTRSWPGSQKEKHTEISKIPRTWFDRTLSVIELVAIIGLIYILISGFSKLGSFNQTVAASFRQPIPEPTPIIRAVVLPDGHTPPNGPGGARPNEGEIPEHLRPLWQSLSNLPTPMLAPEQAIRIQIPAIDVDAPVVQGDSWNQLKKGVGQQVGTPDPGKQGNVVLSGHNDVYGEVFRYLDRLILGDRVILFTNQRLHLYCHWHTDGRTDGSGGYGANPGPESDTYFMPSLSDRRSPHCCVCRSAKPIRLFPSVIYRIFPSAGM